ncbi:WG repeat-containing protein, partial [Halomonas sp. 707D4]
DIEASMERVWISFDRESQRAEIYMEAQAEPLRYDFDFENQQATSPDNPSARIQFETPEQFVLIHGEPFEVAFTFYQIDEDDTEFAALQSARDEWLGNKNAALDERGAHLAELFEVEPLALDTSDEVAWDLPYVFDMPNDWDVRVASLDISDLLKPEALVFSTDFGVPTLLVGKLATDSDTFRQSVISPNDIQETIELEGPDRSLTVFMNQEGNLGLVGTIDNDQDATSFWLMEPNDFGVTRDIQQLIAMFYTIRVMSSPEEHISFTDPDTWPHYRLTEESERILNDRLRVTLSLEEMLGLMGGQVRATTFDEDRRRSYPDLNITLVDAEPQPISSMPPLITLGSPDEGEIILWEDGNHIMCQASLSLPILSNELEEIAYIRISEHVNHYSDDGPDFSRFEYCISAWRALQNFNGTFENDFITDTPMLARALGEATTATSRDDYIFVTKKFDNENLQGLISDKGETILPIAYKRINIQPNFIIAQDSQGKRILSKDGEEILPWPLIAFDPLKGCEGYYIFVHSNDQGEWRKGIFDINNQKIILPPEFRSIYYEEDRDLLLVEYADRSKALLSVQGELFSERYASLHPLRNTPNYLVESDEEEIWYIVNDQLETTSEMYSYARINRFAQLIYVKFPEDSSSESSLIDAYIDYHGNRILSDEMTQEYAPSDDGYITAWVERKPFFGILGNPEQRWGLVDRTGETVIPFEYEKIHQAREGVVPVRRNEKFAVFSVNGSQLTDFEWGNLTPSFSGGLMAQLYSQDTWQLIDHEGNLRNQLIFDERPTHTVLEHHDTGMQIDAFITRHEQRYGLISAAGEILVPFDYTSIGSNIFDPIFFGLNGTEKRYPDDFR